MKTSVKCLLRGWRLWEKYLPGILSCVSTIRAGRHHHQIQFCTSEDVTCPRPCCIDSREAFSTLGLIWEIRGRSRAMKSGGTDSTRRSSKKADYLRELIRESRLLSTYYVPASDTHRVLGSEEGHRFWDQMTRIHIRSQPFPRQTGPLETYTLQFLPFTVEILVPVSQSISKDQLTSLA